MVLLLSQNPQRPFFHFLCLCCGFIEARLKVSAAMLPSLVDGGFPIVGHDDEFRRSIIVMATKCDNVCLRRSGREIAKKRGENKGGLPCTPLNARDNSLTHQ